MGRAVQLLLKPTVSGSNLVDTVRGASAALVTNMTTAADSPFGAGESSITFGGVCAGITTPSYLTNTQLSPRNKSFTLEGWIKHTGSAAGKVFEADDSSSFAKILISYAADASLSCVLAINSERDGEIDLGYYLTNTISANLYTHGVSSGWVHFAYVVDTSDQNNVICNLYINGNIAASSYFIHYIDTSKGTPSGGVFSGYTYYLNGFSLPYTNIGVMFSATATGASFYGLQYTTGEALYTSTFTPPASGNPLNVSGFGKIYGTVYQGSTPISTLLRCYKVSDGSLVGSTTSASDGTYEFNNLTIGSQYFVVSANNIYQDISSKVVTAVSM